LDETLGDREINRLKPIEAEFINGLLDAVGHFKRGGAIAWVSAFDDFGVTRTIDQEHRGTPGAVFGQIYEHRR
jgi:hypothetical protein